MFLTPAELKKASKNLTVADLTTVDSYNRNVLHASAQYCRANLKALLKKKQLDVNSADEFGNTALMYAARSADARRMNLLIRNILVRITRRQSLEHELNRFVHQI